MTQMILFSAAAGIGGMGLGGLISAVLLRRPSENMTCWLLSFAAGVMISIVCFGLVPETLHLAGTAVCLTGLILGIIIIMLLNRVVDRITETRQEHLIIHHTYEELYHESSIIENRTKMLRSGILMIIAISLHNIPEGIAIGAGGSHDFRLGAMLAIMIAFHNIPEGLAVATPLMAGGINRWYVVFLTMLSGATTLLGGILGIAVGSFSNLSIAISLSMAGGAMLYIVFGEIIPQSIVMTNNRAASIASLFGIIIGMLITRI